MSEESRPVKEVHMQSADLHSHSYAKLLRRLVLITVACSVLPMLLVGWIIYYRYSQFSHARMVDYFQRKVEYNRKLVESFLKERTNDLKLIAFTHSLDFMADPSNLQEAFRTLNREGAYFTDLGVIGENGKHRAYVGPYDLMDKDYSQTFWFKELMTKGVYISDMFMGYRKVPHFIIAALDSERNSKWILRATVDTEFLSSLVESTKLGESGEVFILNREGVYQTSPRFDGKIMDSAMLPMDSFPGESGLLTLDSSKGGAARSHPKQVLAYSWLREPNWLLVVRQDHAEVFQDLQHASTAALLIFLVSILVILIVSFYTARYMIKIIKKRDEEAERLNKQLLQTSKLASIGELAAGVAHEINNPLAVIFSENQVVRDMCEEEANLDGDFRNELIKSLSQVDAQVLRCSHITQNLLRFSRRVTAVSQYVDLNTALEDVVGLLKKRAETCGVELSLHLEANLPMLCTDPFELEQVFLNLINNAIDAHEGRPYGSIRVTSRFNSTRNELEATVADTGSGISAENLERIFDPFFTTKPVGKGTGLGLSISYSIIRHMGGDVFVRSELDKGTEFTILLPCPPVGGQGEDFVKPRKEEADENPEGALGG